MLYLNNFSKVLDILFVICSDQLCLNFMIITNRPGHVENSLVKPWKEVILQFIFSTKLSQQT